MELLPHDRAFHMRAPSLTDEDDSDGDTGLSYNLAGFSALAGEHPYSRW